MALDIKFRALNDDNTPAGSIVPNIMQAYEDFKNSSSENKSLIMFVSTNASQMQKFSILKGADPQSWLGQIPRTRVDTINAMLDSLATQIKADNTARLQAKEAAEKAKKQEAMTLKQFVASENPEIINAVKQNNPIIDVVGKYTDVIQNKEGDYIAKSPLYKNGGYTLILENQKQRFFDFGIGKNGDILDFVVQAEKQKSYREISKEDVVKKFIRSAPEKYSDEIKNKVFVLENKVDEINEIVKEYYKSGVEADNGKCIAYFKSRGFSEATIKKFGLGYAKGDWNGLRSYMHKHNYGDEQLAAAGVVIYSDKSNRYFDFLHDRAVIPIHDTNGKCVGFGGRTLTDDSVKYLNTKETPAFHKGEVLFNYNVAKNSTQPSIIVVEGFMDAISAYQSGLDNCVAGMGTALTMEQAELLKATGKEVILAYDNDSSGKKASAASKEILESIGVNVTMFDVSKLSVCDKEGNVAPVKDFNDVLVGTGITGISRMFENQNMNVTTYGYILPSEGNDFDEHAVSAFKNLGVSYKQIKKGNNKAFLFDTRKANDVRQEINILSGNAQRESPTTQALQ